MNSTRAKRIAKDFIGRKIGDWVIDRYINAGKSALVLKASRGRQRVALKVFDPELIDRFGKKKQMVRIERELLLIDKRHKHLIEILDGGYCQKADCYYIVMELFNGANLSKALNVIERKQIHTIISQIASAAEFLENLGLVHRDIKPENVGITEKRNHAVLLDLGIIRPVGLGKMTDDEDTRVFVGTLQYSSTEFLFRKEKDTVEGWRALTFYQLGALLHDMIMRRPIFEKFKHPYACLVEAVKNETPNINCTDAPAELVCLARNCLVKDPELRLKLVSWKDFHIAKTKYPKTSEIKRRIRSRQLIRQHKISSCDSENEEERRFAIEYKLNHISEIIKDKIRSLCVDNKLFPPMEINSSYEGGSSMRFTILFPPSNKHASPAFLAVLVQLSLLDPDSEIIQLCYSAAIRRKGSSLLLTFARVKSF